MTDLHEDLTKLCDAADAEVFGDEVEKADLRRLLAKHSPTAPAVEALRVLHKVEAERDMFRDDAHRAIRALGVYDKVLDQVRHLVDTHEWGEDDPLAVRDALRATLGGIS